jgi:hypothetical protein
MTSRARSAKRASAGHWVTMPTSCHASGTAFRLANEGRRLAATVRTGMRPRGTPRCIDGASE